jgi:nucleotide-binding universal stress UspA family protein
MGAAPDSRLRRRLRTSEKANEGDLMPGSIICGVDESASAQEAARVARGLSRELGLTLVFVRVVDEGSGQEKFGAAADTLKRVTSPARDVDSDAQWRVEVGHPADRLVAVAEDASASMIVVGSHGPRSSLLGSVSAEVSRRAPCPVVVVPPGAGDGLGQRQEQGEGYSGLRAGLGVSNVGGIVRFDLGSHQT